MEVIDDIKAAELMAESVDRIREELGKVIIGQHEVINQLLIALFSNAHCFMEGVPGLAKTLLVSSLARLMRLEFKRIQFTPDLMPADIIGTDIVQEDPQTGRRYFEFFRGPLFTNILLADEINRTPPKTQAALLEAMQERQVTVGPKTYKLAEPFFVLATQNPIEQEGTYPLPEAQLDRFMLNILVHYPNAVDELEILKRTTGDLEPEISPILDASTILALQKVVRRVPVSDHVFAYALEVVRRTRPHEKNAPHFVKEWVEVGAGPRAGQYLILGGKVRALMHGRFYVTTEDINYLALPVLRHRIITNFNADVEGVRNDDIIINLLKELPPPSEQAT
ncbi:MAG: MoxR family ATPase [Lentisphaerae bacterium]|nr:MAG: MoxR family ATPase [Lentisphaerota bacterium]